MQQQLSNNLLTLGCIDEKVSMLHLSMQEKKKTNFTHTFQFNFIKFFFIRIFSCSFNLSKKKYNW